MGQTTIKAAFNLSTGEIVGVILPSEKFFKFEANARYLFQMDDPTHPYAYFFIRAGRLENHGMISEQGMVLLLKTFPLTIRLDKNGSPLTIN